MHSKILLDIYERLLQYYGPQHWWPAETRFEMIIGAILVQSVSWSNVKKAINNLVEASVLEPVALDILPIDNLGQLIRSSRFFNAKARKIKAFLGYLQGYGYDLDAFLGQSIETLRAELLSIDGIGPETADSIILYAAQKPVFVIDAYTLRLLSRLGLVSQGTNYGELQTFLENNLPREILLFQEYHALIVHHCNSTCQKKPRCADCPLFSICAYNVSQPTSGPHSHTTD